MLKSSVSSYVISIRQCRKTNADHINMRKRFGNHGDQDIVDILEEKIKDAKTFNLNNGRFGEGTTADNETGHSEDSEDSALSEENAGLVTKQSKAQIELVEIVEKKTVTRNIGNIEVELYKFLHFIVKYGENGDCSEIQKENGKEIVRVGPNDYNFHEYHVVVVFPLDEETEDGIVFFEARGNHRIVMPMRRVLKKALKKVGDEYFTTEVRAFASDAVVKKYLDNGKLARIHIMTEKSAGENESAINYQEREIIYKVPVAKGLNNFVRQVMKNGYEFVKNTKDDFTEIREWNPKTIKFDIVGKNGKTRTFTAGKMEAEYIAEVLPDDVIRADGTTDSKKFIKEVNEIYEEQHLNLN